ncbi:AAA family ATPase [Pectobacterium zantedeschiae]|uniref:ATP-dependent endonuclease n=1 Tax=Pectobacterium zantedeschiae TaxID=2034769 RepID=A0A9X8JIU9_9GAMM|nr:ATP-dependent endonuclease [Pectobacterium zantedeschiae]RYC43653.1 ATP-dependent endonuclease [Pectobacterium zantedeschiae]RYC49125.1 ATP-dependent endonuclease [Pectobacterium zantedeschiae]
MRIKFVEITNFRKLKCMHLNFDKKTTILVGANNSGKTSAMLALRIFLLSPNSLALRDVTIANWTKIDLLGDEWEVDREPTVDLNALLPSLDVWLDVPLSEIQHVVNILPTLDWSGGMLGVRLSYRVKDLDELKTEYLIQRSAARDASVSGPDGKRTKIALWPGSLTEFLDRRLRAHLELVAYPLDPTAVTMPGHDGLATPQILPANVLAFDHPPFKNLIKIDEIAAQRDFADAGSKDGGEDKSETANRRFKRRLSDQLRSYYDRHLDPSKTPSEKDYEALGAIQAAERSFDARLEAGFAAAFEELEDLGYPGMNNPKLKISTLLRATDGMKHGSSVQYQVADPLGDGTKTLKLPEDYSGLGYQNLIAMVFMLMGFRDEWMRVKKAGLLEGSDVSHEIQPLHLVLVEEPEAHLHAQVQQVFINKAYGLLRKHDDLGDSDTYCTQLIVSTHSSHVAHEADFANLRYFRRRPAASKGETPTTTVANLSHIFGNGDETKRFVKRYLKATHCDLFFADGVIFVEGQAERILVPHFIRHHFPELSRRYITLLELGGSHAHKFRDLVDVLGVATLIISDLDATMAVKITDKNGNETTRWKSARPEKGKEQETANSVLKEWHPGKISIDELIALPPEGHASTTGSGYELYVAYQKPVKVPSDGDTLIIPRTFEDALIIENLATVANVEGSVTSKKIREIVTQDLAGDDLENELFDLLKTAEKAAFALDCLMLEDPKALKPPSYIAAGLKWFESAVGNDVVNNEIKAGPVHDND